MIVTFYSYKGGVGRSMALANVGEWFRERGLRVVMVDWDLEAPGLESFFATDTTERDSIRGRLSLIDLIVTYRDIFSSLPRLMAERSETNPETAGSALREAVRVPASERANVPRGTTLQRGPIKEFVATLDNAMPPVKHMLVPIKSRPGAPQSSGNLWLLPAGCRSDAQFDKYAETVQQFDWADLYANYEGEAYFEWLRRQLTDPALSDIVLIDSRTGVAEMSGVCTRQLADIVVILSAPNDQNLDGVAKMARSFTRADLLEARGNRAIDLVMVAARTDVAEGRPIDLFEAKFHAQLDRYLPAAFRAVGTDFGRLRIPYISAYAFEERLAIGDPEGVKALQNAYSELGTHLALLAPTASAIRSQCVDALKQAFGLPTVIVASVDSALDAEAGQLRERLEAVGFITLPAEGAPESAIENAAPRKDSPGSAASIIVFVGCATENPARVRDLWRRAREQGLPIFFAGSRSAPTQSSKALAIPRSTRVFDPSREFDDLISLLRSPNQARRVPMLAPPVSAAFVGREPELAQLKALALEQLGASSRRPIALVGIGGNGKTTLLKALCQDDEIVDAFDGGILWMSLGPQADLREALVKLVVAFEGDVTTNPDLDEAERRVTEQLATRRCLLIVDDVNDASHLERIPRGGPDCQMILTSRGTDIAIKANAVIIEIKGLSLADSRKVLVANLALHGSNDSEHLNAVISELGGSPLALQLANQALRTRQQLGVAAGPALLELRDSLSREGLTAVDPGLSTSPENSILAAMKLATERLASSDRSRLPFLADVPGGQPVEVARVASLTKLNSEEATAMIQRLAAASLIDYDATSGLLHIHPLTHSFFRSLQQREVRATQTRMARATPAYFLIYLSYRRQDSASYVGRIRDRLSEEFGSGSIFDVEESLMPGDDFLEVIDQRLAKASIVIVVIGPHWLTAVDGSGRRRIEDPGDFVSVEVASALKRSVPVVPVLVGGASAPPFSALPAALASLAHRNALEINDTRFHQGMDHLIDTISSIAGRPTIDSLTEAVGESSRRIRAFPPSMETATPQGITPSKSPAFRWLALASLLLGAGVGLLWVSTPSAPPRPISSSSMPGLQEFARAESYFFGRGTVQDYGEAVKWYLRSAQLGNPSAQNALGRLYEAGNGVSKDLQQAQAWYEKAAGQGHPDAKAALLRLTKSNSSSSTAPTPTAPSERGGQK